MCLMCMDFVFVCCVDVSLLLFDGVFSLMFLLSVAPPVALC